MKRGFCPLSSVYARRGDGERRQAHTQGTKNTPLKKNCTGKASKLQRLRKQLAFYHSERINTRPRPDPVLVPANLEETPFSPRRNLAAKRVRCATCPALKAIYKGSLDRHQRKQPTTPRIRRHGLRSRRRVFRRRNLVRRLHRGHPVGLNRGQRLQTDRAHRLHIDWGLCPGKMSYRRNKNNDLSIWRRAVILR